MPSSPEPTGVPSGGKARPVRPSQAPEEPSGPLRILLSCPECGAPFEVDDTVRGLSCEHCGSLLVLSAPHRDEIYLGEERLKSREELLDVVIAYRLNEERGRIIDMTRDEDGNVHPPSPAVMQARLEAFEKQLRERAKVLLARSFHAPYWHISGQIVQGILGRHRDGPKVVRLRAFAVEHTVPGYDPATANLRDGGLRLANSRVRPLTVEEVRARERFLPWVLLEEQTYREIEKWRGWDLDPGVQAVVKYGLFLYARRLLVYRPYWIARIQTDRPPEWLLMDAGFGTIAGHPDEHEAEAVVRRATADPLDSTEESFRKVIIVTSRCPDCGFDQKLEPGAHIALCPNCHLALKPEATGIKLVGYEHAVRGQVRLDGDYVPFWRFEFEIRIGTGAPLHRLEDYAKAQIPQGMPSSFHPSGPHLWIPARRFMGTESGDEAVKALFEWIHGQPPTVNEGKLPLGGTPVLWAASLSEQEARALAPFLLLGLHGKASAARLNAALIKTTVQNAKLTLTNPRLVLVPVDRQGEELYVAGTGIRIPLPLMKGGPELERYRASVHRAKTASV